MLNATKTESRAGLHIVVSITLMPWVAFIEHPGLPGALVHAVGLSLVFAMIAIAGLLGAEAMVLRARKTNCRPRLTDFG